MKNKVKGFNQYIKEDCGSTHYDDYLEPVKQMSGVCAKCGQFPDSCECKGSCGNCGDDNGGCNCAQNQNFEIGDVVRNVNSDCPNHTSTGRIVEMPEDNSITYTVIKPSANSFIGQLLNKSSNQLTIDEKYRV